MWRRHVCYVCKRSVCGGDEPQPVAHLSHKLQCARQKIMFFYGNKYPRHNARPHVVEQSGQCARALIGRNSRKVSATCLRGIFYSGFLSARTHLAFLCVVFIARVPSSLTLSKPSSGFRWPPLNLADSCAKLYILLPSF